MSEVIQLFPELPRDVKEGDLVWLPRFAALGDHDEQSGATAWVGQYAALILGGFGR